MATLVYVLSKIVADSIFVAPAAILIIGAILYYYKPIHRLALGIILVTLGSIGLLIYSVVFYLVLANDSSLTGISLILITIFAEILTFCIGIKSIMNRNVNLSP